MSKIAKGTPDCATPCRQAAKLQRLETLFSELPFYSRGLELIAGGTTKRGILAEIASILQMYPEFCSRCFPVENESLMIMCSARATVRERLHGPPTGSISSISTNTTWSRNHSCTPLAIFLALDAAVDLIEKIFNLDPNAVLVWDKLPELSAIHVAVWKFQKFHFARARSWRPVDPITTIIPLFARKCPDSLKIKDSNGIYPLQIMLDHASRSDSRRHIFRLREFYRTVIRPLVEIYPDPMNRKGDLYGNSPLGFAIHWDLGARALGCLVERLPATQDNLVLTPVARPNRNDGIPIHLEYAQEIVKVLPQLKNFTLACHGWTQDGLAYFLRHLQANTSIQCLDQLSLPFHTVSSSPALIALLPGCCKQLKRLVLSHCYWEDGISSAMKLDCNHESILDTLTSTPSVLEELELSGMNIPNIHTLMRILGRDTFPKRLRIRGLVFLSPDPIDDSAVPSIIAANNVLESLTLGLSTRHGFDDRSNQCFENLIYQLANFPHLKSLDLRVQQFSSRADVILGHRIRDANTIYVPLNGSVEHLLSTAPCLQNLTLRNFKCREESVINTLRSNNTLESFTMPSLLDGVERVRLADQFYDLLQNDNTTLREISIPKGGHSMFLQAYSLPAPVTYWLSLNQWGRSHFRNPSTPPSRLIDLIVDIPTDEQESVFYGLLREMPSLWCQQRQQFTQVPGRKAASSKRKYSEMMAI